MFNIVGCTPDELSGVIETTIRRVLAEYKMPANQTADTAEKYYCVKEAAARLKVSQSFLYSRVKGRNPEGAKFPHTRLGKAIRFTETHLREIAALNGKEAEDGKGNA